MNDTAAICLDRFLMSRERPLTERFPGFYRAMVVETNDPLNMHRIRFKCPDMHDWDLKPEECPWAVSQFALGGKRAGSWVCPCIGDWVWITLEKQHPYGPIWTGFATPTRRKFYPYPAVYGVTPLPVDLEGSPTKSPDDYNKDFLPKDSRPMSSGLTDRYGNLDLSSAVGFFPIEHKEKPPGPDNDPLQSQTTTDPKSRQKTPYKQTSLPPEMNKPDCKFMLRLSKYGHMFLLGDQGYHWQKPNTASGSSGGSVGEFLGDADKDETWEANRWKYMQQLINEGAAEGTDQRRMMLLTRYGHKFEMRDVGWKKTRDGEYGDPVEIADSNIDQRWMKLRTKGGMLFQMSDIGFDPVEDHFVKRKLLEEVGTKTEKEDQFWKGDGRWIRWVTRHGYKLVLDDRGSDKKEADTKEIPHGYGILLKGRRSPAAQGISSEGDPRGFYWEFNERDQVNQSTWGSPLGHTIQINDKLQYCMIGCNRSYAKPWMGIRDNEFLEDPLVFGDTELTSHHLKLDHHNEYLRLKTAGGNGPEPWGTAVNPRSRSAGIQQGLECRDGTLGGDPWTELVDIDDRGLWFSGNQQLVVCRARQRPDAIRICWWFDEGNREIVIRNAEQYDGEGGIRPKIQIACDGDVELIAKRDVSIYARGQVNIRGSDKLVLMGGSGLLEVASDAIKMNKVLRVPGFGPPVGIPAPNVLSPSETPQIKPANRGKRHNEDLEINKDIPA